MRLGKRPIFLGIGIISILLLLAVIWTVIYSKTPKDSINAPPPCTSCVYLQIERKFDYISNNLVGDSYCGGTLYKGNYIITAAHCLIGATAINISLGLSRLGKPVKKIFSDNFEIHELFNNDTFQNDIAIVYLCEEMESSKDITSIELWDRSHKIETSVIAATFGAFLDPRDDGVTSDDTGTDNIEFNLKPVKIEENHVCVNMLLRQYQIPFKITDSQMCTVNLDRKIGPCPADSGGPLLLNNKQVGIVSSGVEECPIDAPTVYTRIDKYIDWIDVHTNIE